MKNLKNVLSVMAFVFAIGAAFAFKPVAPLDNLQTVNLKDGSCTQTTGPDECTSTTATPKCTIQVGEDFYEFVNNGNCSTASLGDPNP